MVSRGNENTVKTWVAPALGSTLFLRATYKTHRFERHYHEEFAIGIIESLTSFWIGPAFKDVVVFILFLAVLWFRPQGLMGKT